MTTAEKGARLIVLLAGIALLAFPGFAETESGPRIPTTYFVTTGVGQSNEGIPPDPYETFSYDIALLDAGIENFNVVYYTSVLPAEACEISLAEASLYFHHGAVLEAILAKAGGRLGDTVVAGVGRVWAVDEFGRFVGGFAAEYEYVYDRQQVSPDQARQDAIAQLTKSLKHELEIRNLRQQGEMRFDIAPLYITENYGIALAALGFLNFIYPDPIPVLPPIE